MALHGAISSCGANKKEVCRELRHAIRIGDESKALLIFDYMSKVPDLACLIHEEVVREMYASGAFYLNMNLMPPTITRDFVRILTKSPKTPIIRASTIIAAMFLGDFIQKDIQELRRFLSTGLEQEASHEEILCGLNALAALLMIGDLKFLEILKPSFGPHADLFQAAMNAHMFEKNPWHGQRFLFATLYFRSTASIFAPPPGSISTSLQIHLKRIEPFMDIRNYCMHQFGPGCSPITEESLTLTHFTSYIIREICEFAPNYIQEFHTLSPKPHILRLSVPYIPIAWQFNPKFQCVREIPENAKKLPGGICMLFLLEPSIREVLDIRRIGKDAVFWNGNKWFIQF